MTTVCWFTVLKLMYLFHRNLQYIVFINVMSSKFFSEILRCVLSMLICKQAHLATVHRHSTYSCHLQASGPGPQATSDSKHRHSLYVCDHHNVFSVQRASTNKTSQKNKQVMHKLLLLTLEALREHKPRRDPDRHQNCITWSLSHALPLQKISS